MYFKIKKKGLLVSAFALLFVVSSCIPFCDSSYSIYFKNCTDDTLLIGVAHCDDIDSVVAPLCVPHSSLGNENHCSEIKLWKSIERNSDIIYPDSLCDIFDVFFWPTNDTCYFFLVKYRDAKLYSYDEIRAKKLYGKFVVTRDANGDYDRNIRYTDK